MDALNLCSPGLILITASRGKLTKELTRICFRFYILLGLPTHSENPWIIKTEEGGLFCKTNHGHRKKKVNFKIPIRRFLRGKG